jgi:hypothetical protein
LIFGAQMQDCKRVGGCNCDKLKRRYKVRTKFLFVLLFSCAFLCFTQSAGAAPVSFDLVTEFSGAQTPAGSPSWGTARFEDTATNVVTLTMSANINQATSGEFIRFWYFNFDPTLNLTAANFDPDPLATNAGGIAVLENFLKADGDGYFDFRFDWRNPASDPDGGFDSGSVTWTIEAAGLTAEDFDFLSVKTQGGTDTTGGLRHAAHVQGLANDGSGWLTEIPAPIPIPGSALLLAPGLILLGALRRKFKS